MTASYWLGRLAYWGVVMAVTAALTYGVAILALPYRSLTNAAGRLTANAGARLPFDDPAMATAACAVDLRGRPALVRLDVADVGFAALTLYGRSGRVLYGLTDRSASQNQLVLRIMTPAQAAREPAPADQAAATDYRVVVEEPPAFARAEVLAPEPSLRPSAENAAGRLSCGPA